MKKDPQPAKKLYFFGKAYENLKTSISNTSTLNQNSISSLGDTGIFLVSLPATISIFLLGWIFTLVMTGINLLFLLFCSSIQTIFIVIFHTLDVIYFSIKKIFFACPNCKEKSLIPAYHCPSCHKEHTRLTPNTYGIFKHTCECGTKMPSMFFLGRKNLEASCPFCHASLNDRESRPLCIPVVGGRSVGKTAFITAFSKDFIEEVAPKKNIDIEFYNQEKEDIFHEITRDYNSGSTRMTAKSLDVTDASSISFSFFAKHKSFKPERLIHVYDIAGEVFTDNTENEVQKQYNYCQGVVLMIDPFSIPSVRNKYENSLDSIDSAGIGEADSNEIINSFLNKLRAVTGLNDSQITSMPIAVVIGKIDSAGLQEELGEQGIRILMSQQPKEYGEYYEAMDYLCRKFFKDNHMEGFLNNICIQFKTNRFFSCSAIGHTRDDGIYQPWQVMAPMQWLFGIADPRMAKLWNDAKFQTKIKNQMLN